MKYYEGVFVRTRVHHVNYFRNMLLEVSSVTTSEIIHSCTTRRVVLMYQVIIKFMTQPEKEKKPIHTKNNRRGEIHFLYIFFFPLVHFGEVDLVDDQGGCVHCNG
jgi:hypothetical protein